MLAFRIRTLRTCCNREIGWGIPVLPAAWKRGGSRYGEDLHAGKFHLAAEPRHAQQLREIQVNGRGHFIGRRLLGRKCPWFHPHANNPARIVMAHLRTRAITQFDQLEQGAFLVRRSVAGTQLQIDNLLRKVVVDD